MEIPYKANHGVPGKGQSFWIDSTPDTDYSPLKGDVSVDAAVLGGGIAGVTTALLLKRGGLKVAIVEADRIVKGVTGYATVDNKKVAAYRDESGELHAISPACMHLVCYVEWNDGERTWDCPCHGSRYTYDGKVIHSPTVINMAEEKGNKKI